MKNDKSALSHISKKGFESVFLMQKNNGKGAKTFLKAS